MAHSLFSFRRRHRVVMNDRNSAKLDQRIVSTEAGLAATIAFLSLRPVGGEMFLLTAPFIERPMASRVNVTLLPAEWVIPALLKVRVLPLRSVIVWRPATWSNTRARPS